MKKILSIFFLLISQTFAQSPQLISYQAVIRNLNNSLVTNTTVGMRISILQSSASGTAVYVETHMPVTNANGLISIEIGNGTIITGTLSGIDWGAGPYFIKSETDPTGGTNYSITGVSQLLSVPYALHAAKSDSCGNISGIPNYISKFNSTNSLDTSQIFDDGVNVGIGTDTPSTKLDVNGYTKLGESSPKIKLKTLTGTTAITDGGSVAIPHGLNSAKILSVDIFVLTASQRYYPPDYIIFENYLYNFYYNGSNVVVTNGAPNTPNTNLITSRPIKILITYEE